MAASTDSPTPKLSELFDKVIGIYDSQEKSEEATNSKKCQDQVKDAIQACEKAVFMINTLSLFSDNEVIEEVATGDMRYMVLSAYLGHFTLQETGVDRSDSLNKAKTFYLDYLKLIKSYEVTSREIPENLLGSGDGPIHTGQSEDLQEQQRKRQGKIDRYKAKQSLDKQMKELYKEVSKEHVDDEVEREYYQTMMSYWWEKGLEELANIQSEREILDFMASRKGPESKSSLPTATETQKDPPPKKSLRPFIVTKDMMQKSVFGLGYPSIPTYTIDEFYDRQVEVGNLPPPGTKMGLPPSEEETTAQEEEQNVVKEYKIEGDDPQTLQEARNWDEWKDDHRRGWGNRKNMG